MGRADLIGRTTAWRGQGDQSASKSIRKPGMTETSLVPELAARAGISFDELVRWMVADASLNR